MNIAQKETLVKLAGRKISFDCPMTKYTTLQVGGRCEGLFNADDLDELRQVIAFLNKESIAYLVVGRGSNLLVKDEGLDALVIILKGSLAAIEQENTEDLNVLVGAGLPLVDLLKYCRNAGLGGLECFAGIPGTVGGAVVMNAGAFGDEFGNKVRQIHLITPQGDLVTRDRSQLRFSYRYFEIERGMVAVRARLELHRESEKIIAERIADFLKRRKLNQPLEYPSAGSVFKNPPNDYAGRLIENAGLKGKKIGGAMISEKHANFIVNIGGAKAKDVLDLLDLAREEVKKQTGIELEPEIRIVGI